MRKSLPTALILLGALVTAPSARADDEAAEDKLGEAIVQYGLSHHDRALALLTEAENLSSDPLLLAKIFRQRGLVGDAKHQNLEALAAFLDALKFDSNIAMNAREHRPSAVRLFDCAKTLFGRGIDAATARERYASAFAKDGWSCPSAAEAPVASAPKAAPSAPAPAQESPAAKTAVEPSSGPPLLTWVAFGVGAAAIGAGAILGASALAAARDGNPATDPHGPAMGANIAYGVGGLAIAGGLALWLLGSGSSSESAAPSAAHATVSILPGGAFVGAVREF
jgi:hypothetical protein